MKKTDIPFPNLIVPSGFPYRLDRRQRKWGSCCFSPLPWIAACASSGMNDSSERGKKTGFWYERLRVQWEDPRRMKHMAGGSWRGIMGTCSREGVGFNGLK